MLLTRLMYRGFGLWRLVGALGGALLGWVLLFGGLQLWSLIDRNLIHREQVLGAEYFIIHKPVPFIKLGGAVAFSDAEIADLQKQPGVQTVAPLLSSRFHAHASFSKSAAVSGFETELFFDAVPDEFLDVKPKDWEWHRGDETIPIVMPRDYLALYNFGFAQSQNLPQLSDALLSQLRFNLELSGQGQVIDSKGRIVGFTQRINTLLVPMNFLEWANATLGEGQPRTSRLIIKTSSPTDPRLLKFFEEKKYEYNTEKLKAAKLGSALRLLLYVVCAFGVVVLILALWILALSFQLLIARNYERLQKLVWLGYHPRVLVKNYVLALLAMLIVVNVAGFLLLGWGTSVTIGLFGRYGFPMEPIPSTRVLFGMVILTLGILGVNYLILRRQIYSLSAGRR